MKLDSTSNGIRTQSHSASYSARLIQPPVHILYNTWPTCRNSTTRHRAGIGSPATCPGTPLSPSYKSSVSTSSSLREPLSRAAGAVHRLTVELRSGAVLPKHPRRPRLQLSRKAHRLTAQYWRTCHHFSPRQNKPDLGESNHQHSQS